MGIAGTKDKILSQDKNGNLETVDQVSEYLTPRQIEIIRETWEVIQGDLPSTGVTVFKR